MNLLQDKFKCVECKSKKLVKDFKRKEIYCSKCGLVLLNNDIPLLEDMQTLNNENLEKQKNKKTEKLQYYKIKEHFYNFF